MVVEAATLLPTLLLLLLLLLVLLMLLTTGVRELGTVTLLRVKGRTGCTVHS